MDPLKTYDFEPVQKSLTGEVRISVEYVSDGNDATTKVRTADNREVFIAGETPKVIGKAKDLKAKSNKISCTIKNFHGTEDTIAVNIKVNGETVISHSAPKSESNHQLVYFKLKIQ